MSNFLCYVDSVRVLSPLIFFYLMVFAGFPLLGFVMVCFDCFVQIVCQMSIIMINVCCVEMCKKFKGITSWTSCCVSMCSQNKVLLTSVLFLFGIRDQRNRPFHKMICSLWQMKIYDGMTYLSHGYIWWLTIIQHECNTHKC